jgi:hypothetical protein
LALLQLTIKEELYFSLFCWNGLGRFGWLIWCNRCFSSNAHAVRAGAAAAAATILNRSYSRDHDHE